MRRGQQIVGLFGWLLSIACSSEVVTLGQVAAGGTAGAAGSAAVDPAPMFSPPTLVAELVSDGDESDNPTLTADRLEIYFTSEREGGAGNVDVWTARRSSVDDPFGPPEPVEAVNSDQTEASPAVSLDGRELWFGTERDGGLGEQDIWRARRESSDDAWSEPLNVPELSSTAKDIPRPPAVSGRIMPLGSRRGSSGYYETFLAERPNEDEPFASPHELIELEVAGQNTVDGFLTEDGLTLFFNRSPGAGESSGDLFVARRKSLSEPFGAVAPLLSINTSQDERDPWLSPDGRYLYFSSDRDGTLNIYEARAIDP
jgi:WD40-like Beta Propeller Repeat